MRVCVCPCPVKILEKRHIMKENKAQYVKRERDVMSNLDHPFFVKLYFTFQDEEKLCILDATHTQTSSHFSAQRHRSVVFSILIGQRANQIEGSY